MNISESLSNQRGIDGSFHPNGKGQDVYAAQIFGTLAPALEVSGGAAGWRGFSDTPTTLTTDDATSVAAGDVNGDGLPDLVVGANGSATQLFINSGNDATTGDWDGFEDGVDIATAATQALALGDVDADGDLDLFVGSNGGNALYLNNGTGTFTAAASTLFAAGTANTTAVALADLNGDQRPDLIVANSGSAGQVFLNRGLDRRRVGRLRDDRLGDVRQRDVSPRRRSQSATPTTTASSTSSSGRPPARRTSSSSTAAARARLARASRPPSQSARRRARPPAVALANVSNGSGPDILVVNDGSANLFYKPTPSKLTRLAAANVSATLGTDAIADLEGEGAFVITPRGLAGTFSGKVTASAGGFDANISIRVRINSTPYAGRRDDRARRQHYQRPLLRDRGRDQRGRHVLPVLRLRRRSSSATSSRSAAPSPSARARPRAPGSRSSSARARSTSTTARRSTRTRGIYVTNASFRAIRRAATRLQRRRGRPHHRLPGLGISGTAGARQVQRDGRRAVLRSVRPW